MTTIEKIRAEINAMFPPSGNWMYDEGYAHEHTVCEVLVDVLQIIDKYAEQEPCDTIAYHDDFATALIKISEYEDRKSFKDVVSRQAVDEYIVKLLSGYLYEEERERIEKLNAYLWDLPSVRPQEQTGEWIEKDGFDGDVYYDCSECGESWTTIEGTPWDNEWNYCPNCGAKMVELQESGDKT